MKHFSLIVICLCCLAFAACASSKKRKQQQAEEQQASVPLPPAPVAPGSARVLAEIVSLDAVAGGYHCTVKIRTVEAYGANTPPLAEGSEILVLVRDEVLEASETAKVAASALAPGLELALTMNHQQSPDFAGKKSPAWRATIIR